MKNSNMNGVVSLGEEWNLSDTLVWKKEQEKKREKRKKKRRKNRRRRKKSKRKKKNREPNWAGILYLLLPNNRIGY